MSFIAPGSYLFLASQWSQSQNIDIEPEVLTVSSQDPCHLRWSCDLPCTLDPGRPYVQAVPVSPPAGPDLMLSVCDIWQSKPTKTYIVQDRLITGLLDTGADVSLINTKDWDPAWETQPCGAVRGVGGAVQALVSTHPLQVSNPETKKVLGFITPTCLPLQVNLWGRDLMSQMQATLSLND